MRNIILTLALVMGMSIAADAQVFRIEGSKAGSTVTLNIDLGTYVNEATNTVLGCVIISGSDGSQSFREFAGVQMRNKNIYVNFDDGSTLTWYNRGDYYVVTLGDYTVSCFVREVK